MYESHDPIATLVQVFNTNVQQMKTLEKQQLGVGRLGGEWRKIMSDGNISYHVLKNGRKSDFSLKEYDFEYNLIIGNY